MKKYLKLSLSLSLVIIALIALAVTANAYTVEGTELASGFVMINNADGTANDGSENDLRWTVYDTSASKHTMVITGTAAELVTRPSNSWDVMNVGWASYCNNIETLVLDTSSLAEINSSYVFRNMEYLKTVILPAQKLTFNCQKTFSYCWSLETIGPEGTPQYTYDIRTLIYGNDKANHFDRTAYHMNITVLMPYAEKSIAGFDALGELGEPENFNNYSYYAPPSNGYAKSVIFKVKEYSPSETFANYYKDLYSGIPVTVEHYPADEGNEGIIESGTGTCGTDTEYGWSYNKFTRIFTFKWISGEKTFTDKNNSEYSNLYSTYLQSLVTVMKFEGFDKVEGQGGSSVADLWYSNNNLTTIDFGEATQMGLSSWGGGFGRNSKLTTVGSSTYGTLNEGVVDLSAFTTITSATSSVFWYLVYVCPSVKNVILPGAYASHKIDSTTFSGGTNIESLTFPNNDLATWNIASGALAGQTKLKSIYMLDEDYTETSARLPDTEGLTIYCSSFETFKSLKPLYTKSRVVIGDTNIIKAYGFSIRLTGYNGLRTFYTFDNAKLSQLTELGYTFREYGAIVASEERMAGNTLELIKNGDEFIPNIEKAQKAVIASGVGEDGLPNITGKLLLNELDNNADTSDFALTLVNFNSNYTSNIYSCGYVIFTDPDGEEIIEYTNYGEINEGYKFINIYDVTMDMYTNAPAEELLNNSTDEIAVWGTLYSGGAIELEAGIKELTFENISVMIAADKNAKNILFVRRIDGTAPTSDDIAAAEAKISSMNKTFDGTVSFKVTNDGAWESPIFTASSQNKGFADGTLTIYDEEETAAKYQVFWGNKDGKLADYNGFAPIASTGRTTEFTIAPHTLIPENADRLLVYSIDSAGAVSDRAKAALLPEGKVDMGTLKYEFQVMSDIHVTTNEGRLPTFKKALADVIAMSPNSLGIFVNGDSADRGTAEEYGYLQGAIEAAGAELPTMYFGIGNHEANYGEDYIADSTKYSDFDTVLGPRFIEFRNSIAGLNGEEYDKIYFDITIDGAHFVFLGTEKRGIYTSPEQLSWLEAILEEDKADNKPTYIFYHWGVKNTVAGTLDYQGWGSLDQNSGLALLLKKYPEAVLFSGHTHWEMSSSQNMYHYDEEFCTVFNTSSVGYTWNDDVELNGASQPGGSEGYYFYGYEGGFIARGRDFKNGKWIPEAQYVITYGN